MNLIITIYVFPSLQFFFTFFRFTSHFVKETLSNLPKLSWTWKNSNLALISKYLSSSWLWQCFKKILRRKINAHFAGYKYSLPKSAKKTQWVAPKCFHWVSTVHPSHFVKIHENIRWNLQFCTLALAIWKFVNRFSNGWVLVMLRMIICGRSKVSIADLMQDLNCKATKIQKFFSKSGKGHP